jgi:hypothetical protein
MNASGWLRKRSSKRDIPAAATADAPIPGSTAAAPEPIGPAEALAKVTAEPAAAPAAEPVAKVAAEAIPGPAAESPAAAGAAPSRPAGVSPSRMVEVKRFAAMKLPKLAMPESLKGLAASSDAWRKPAALAAAILVAGGVGYAAGSSGGPEGVDPALLARWNDATSEIRDSREASARIAAEMKSVKTSVDGLRVRGDAAARQAQIADRLERNAGETATKIAKLAEQLERIEKRQSDPARLGPLTERLERIERQILASSGPAPASTAAAAPAAVAAAPAAAPGLASAPTPPPKPTSGLDVTQTGSIGEAKPDPRKIQVESYALRDVDDGLALVEGRNGRYFEVAPGMSLPGLGRVEAIERRGRQWVVVTSKGYIGER